MKGRRKGVGWIYQPVGTWWWPYRAAYVSHTLDTCASALLRTEVMSCRVLKGLLWALVWQSFGRILWVPA